MAVKAFDPVRYGDDFRTDAEGRITLPALIPGATYRIRSLQGGVRDFQVEAGLTMDLEDLHLPALPAPAKPAPTPPDKK
jgi:hypothetical protein